MFNSNYSQLKLTGIVFLVVFINCLSFKLLEAKIPTEDLKMEVQTMKGVEKVDGLVLLSQQYLDESNLKSANKHALNAEDIARNLDYKAGLIRSLELLSDIALQRYDYKNAMEYNVFALKVYDEVNDAEGSIRSKIRIAEIFIKEKDFDAAEETLKGLVDENFEHPNTLNSSAINENLGDVYVAKEFVGKAKGYYKKALNQLAEVKSYARAAGIARKMGEISQNLGDYESAEVYYNTSLGFFSSLRNEFEIAQDYVKLAIIKGESSSFEEALEDHYTALDIFKQQDRKMQIAEVSVQISNIMFAVGNDEEGHKYLDQAIKLVDRLDNIPGKENLIHDISAIYKSTGDHKMALEYFAKYTKVKDIIYTKEKSNALIQLTTKYEAEFESDQQQQEIATLNAQQESEKKVRWFLTTLLGLIAVLCLMFYVNYKQKKADNTLLTVKNKEIHRQKEEIDFKNHELGDKNERLDFVNNKLIKEISEREAIEKSSFSRDRFLASMSHEMRTPMNNVVGLAHLLLEDNPRDDQKEYIRSMMFSANCLAVFINDILDFNRIEAGKLNIEKRPFDAKKLLSEVFERTEIAATEHSNILKFYLDERIPDYLEGDPTRLNQIMTNFILALARFNNDTSIEVRVKLFEQNENELMLSIDIEDNGTGIPAELEEALNIQKDMLADDVFDGYKNNTIGVVIAKRLVELQNGKFEYHSSNGGTQLNLMLPFMVPTEENNNANLLENEDAYSMLIGKNVLVVEDNKINQVVVTKMLINLGINVDLAENGIEALEAFKQQAYDLVLMDIQMPLMDGYKATSEIRNLSDPKKRDVPIIALTASAFLSEKDKAQLFGMDDHIGKPFAPDELLNKMLQCFKFEKQP